MMGIRESPGVGPSEGYLVGGWTNPFEKYAPQIGSSPQVRVRIKNIWNHHLVVWVGVTFENYIDM